MYKESGKKTSNKKVKRTKPGESIRNYKNKPLDERIGSSHPKYSFKIDRKDHCCLRKSRNGKSGLKNVGHDAIKNPVGNWHLVSPSFEYDWVGNNPSFDNRVNRITGSNIDKFWHISPSNHNLVVSTEFFDESGRLIGEENDKYKIQKIRRLG